MESFLSGCLHFSEPGIRPDLQWDTIIHLIGGIVSKTARLCPEFFALSVAASQCRFWRCPEELAWALRAGREAAIPRCKGRDGSSSMPIPLVSCTYTVAYPTFGLPSNAHWLPILSLGWPGATIPFLRERLTSSRRRLPKNHALQSVDRFWRATP